MAPHRAPPRLTHHLARWKLWAGIDKHLVSNLGETANRSMAASGSVTPSLALDSSSVSTSTGGEEGPRTVVGGADDACDFVDRGRGIVNEIDDLPVRGTPRHFIGWRWNGTRHVPTHLCLAGKGNPGASSCAQPL